MASSQPSRMSALQQAKNTLHASTQALQGVQQLRTSVTNVFQLLTDGFENIDIESNENSTTTAKNRFLQRLQELLHSINKDFTDLEKLGNNINTSIPETMLLGLSTNLSLDPSVDDPTIYHNLILTYHWQTKLHTYGQLTNILLQQSHFRRSTMGYRKRKIPNPTQLPQNRLYTKTNSQMLDPFILSLTRQYPDLQMKHMSLYNSTKICRLSLEKVFICFFLLKGLLVEKIVVYGRDESYLTESNRPTPNLSVSSRYECMKKITDNATSAYLNFDCIPNQQPDLPIKQFLSWIQSYKNLFTEPCTKCGKISDFGLPPTWRDFTQQHLPYHDTCKP